MSDRKPYDTQGLPWVVTWLWRGTVDEDGVPEDHDMTFGPFPDSDSATAFGRTLVRTEHHGGYSAQPIYPSADYAVREQELT